jgi:hypothetical protein
VSLLGSARTDLLMAVISALNAAGTLAGSNVFSRRIWSLTENQYPAILVSAPLETKHSLSRSLSGAATFDTEVSIALSLRIAGKPSSSGSITVDTHLDLLCAQVENVLMTDPGIISLIQGFGDVHTQYTVTAEGAPVLGDASIVAAYVLRQQFWPDNAVPLTEIDVSWLTKSDVEQALFKVPIAHD